MGVIYIVTPFSIFCEKDLDDMRWSLDEHGLAYPPDADRGRYPTQNEVEEVLRSFNSYEFESHPDSAVGTDKPWSEASLFKRGQPGSGYTFEEYASLIAAKPPRDKDSPCDFYLSKGDSTLNYAILERLAHRCGPLFCITEGEYDAVIFHRKRSGLDPSPSFAADHHLRSKESSSG
jgi:hypothetical protein